MSNLKNICTYIAVSYTHLDVYKRQIIQVDENGQNCILLYGGTNQMLTEEYIDSVLDSFGNNGLVLLQNETNLVGYIMDKAYEKGLQIALNAAPMNEKVLSYPLEKLTWLVAVSYTHLDVYKRQSLYRG